MGMPDAVKQCETRHFINGEFVSSSDGGTFEVKSPYNHETVAHGVLPFHFPSHPPIVLPLTPSHHQSPKQPPPTSTPPCQPLELLFPPGLLFPRPLAATTSAVSRHLS